MQEAVIAHSVSPATSARQQQLATIRTYALALVNQMQSFSADEPIDQQVSWTEYIGMAQDILHFIDCRGEQGAGSEEPQFTKKQLEDFGTLLRDRRDAAGLTRLQLARLAKLSDSTVKFVESARHPPSRKTLTRLLGVPELRLTWEDLPLRPGAAPPAGEQATPRSGADGKIVETDLNWYVTPTIEPVRMVMDLGRFLNGAGGHVEQTNAYLDHQSAAAYLAVCQQSPAIAAMRRNIPLGAIAQRVLKETSPAGLSVIALGSGDANLEVRLVQHLAEEQTGTDIRLCLFDISQPLLSAGFKYATDMLSENPRINVWAMQGNFHHLPLYPHLHHSPASVKRRRIYCLLGNGLINVDNEPRFFRYSLVGCEPGDLLIVDVNQTRGSVAHPEEIRRREPALFNPLPKADAEWFAGPIHRHCKGVVGVELSVELDTQCAMPGSYALDILATVKATGFPDRRFSIFRVKRYDTAMLAQCLARLGWEQLTELPWGSAKDSPSSVALFVKRRPADLDQPDLASVSA